MSMCCVLHRSWQYCFHGLFECMKAFDTVNHIKLLHRMCDIGVLRYVIRLIMNWSSKD